MIESEYSCEVCGKPADSLCGNCQYTAYCTIEHQTEHWRTHKDVCKINASFMNRQREKEVNEKRMQLRKIYFQNFGHKIFDECVTVAQKLVLMEKESIQGTKFIFNELEYGISVCLLSRSYLLLGEKISATVLISSYFDEKIHFLEDLRDIQPIADAQRISPVAKEFVEKKLSLLASVANILFETEGNYLRLYEIYTEHVQKIFGEHSYELSNCYFMIGSYFMERKEYNKAIACYVKASQLRGSKGGDCYYNLGVIYKLINLPEASIEFFKIAAELREKENNENSDAVADVYHNLALIEAEASNFKSAVAYYEKILKIYSKNKKSDEYVKVRESIRLLQKELKHELEKNSELIPSSNPLLSEFKKQIKEKRKTTEDEIRSEKSRDEFISDYDRRSIKDLGKVLKLPEEFINRLNAAEALHLSQLQLELEHSKSEFMAITTIGNSEFLKRLSIQRRVELEKENERLFQLLSTEDFIHKEEEKYSELK